MELTIEQQKQYIVKIGDLIRDDEREQLMLLNNIKSFENIYNDNEISDTESQKSFIVDNVGGQGSKINLDELAIINPTYIYKIYNIMRGIDDRISKKNNATPT